MSGEPALIPMLTPTADCAANKTILAAAIANTNMATVTFTRYPDAIAKGARFIGGMTGRCQTVSAATVGKATSGVRLDDQTNEVLDEVASRGTLTSVGIKLGYSGGYADRAGGKAVLAAGRALLAANDNTAKKAAA
jgi:hypothetical protein